MRRELFDIGKYGLAMQAFKPLTSAFDENIYTTYASFYFALSAYHTDSRDLAKNMLLQIQTNYPEWDQMDEVNLWLVKIYLDDDNIDEAVLRQKNIKDQKIREEGDKLFQNYLQAQTFEDLSQLINRYPSNKLIAEALASKISEQPLFEQDRELLENIVSVYELDESTYYPEMMLKSEKKDHYQVAVLLPFMMKDLKRSSGKISNQFVVDLYEGIRMAQKSLSNRGIEIKLHAYDTQNDAFKTRSILEKPEMEHMDLIIGPLYPTPVRLVSQFAYDHKINMINPLSSNSKIIQDNPFAFLFMPSNETLGKKTAEFVSEKFENKNAMIFYGPEEKDSLMAFNYIQTIEEHGFNVKHVEEIAPDNAKRILDILTSAITVEYTPEELDSIMRYDRNRRGNLKLEEKQLLLISENSIGHILVASDEAPLAANSITAISTRGDSIVLIGQSQWLNSRVITLEAIEHLNIHLIAPGFIKKNTERYDQFNTVYNELNNRPAPKNVLLGYEIMTNLGKLLNRYGIYFQIENNANRFQRGELCEGFFLDGSNNNQYVPLIKFEEAELIIANPYN